MKILNKSMLTLGLITLSIATSSSSFAEGFDYKKASANYVDNTSSGNNDGAGGLNQYYFGATIGASDAGSYCSGSTSCEDGDTAWKVFGGYKISENLSAEASYVNLGDLHKTTGAGTENSDVTALTATAVGSMPINEQFDIFGKVGGMRWSSDNTSGSQDGFGLTYGVGAKMNLNETTKLRAEWEKFPSIETSTTDKTDVNMLSVGVELSTY